MLRVIFGLISSSIIICLLVIYFLIKTKKQFHILQQSGYDLKRYFKYISENKLFYIAFNELILLLTYLIVDNYLFISYLIIFIFVYYNLYFINLKDKYFVVKKKLVYTKRIKRQIVTFIILNVVFIILYLVNSFHIIYLIILITYFNYLLLMLATLINKPIESLIRRKYQKKAINKLKGHPSLDVIGITGSYGKTSIKNIVNQMLEDNAPTLMTPESYNTPNGVMITINNSLSKFHKTFICEMGAYYPGEIKKLANMVSPRIGVVSSIGNQHLETFKTIDNIQKTKMELIENLVPGGIAILNYDEKYIKNYQIKRNDLSIKTYAIDNQDCDVYAKEIEYDIAKMRFTLVDNLNNTSYQIETKLLGRHNIYNILCGYLVTKTKEIKVDKIIASISNLKPIKHRLELKKIDNDTYIIDDAFNANQVGINQGLDIVSVYEEYAKIIITPGLIDLGTDQKQVNYQLGQSIAKKVDISFIIGKYNQQDITSGIENINNQSQYYTEKNFIDAYNKAMKVKGKKIILIANDLPDKFN